MFQPPTRDGRGHYRGFVPSEQKVFQQIDNNADIISDFLEINFFLASEFYPDLDKHDFDFYWREKFQFMLDQGINGRLQLNFPEIPLQDLIEKYRDLTRRLKGTGEDVEGVRNYYPDFFTPEYLREANSIIPDWVTLIVENSNAGAMNDPTMFGLGLPYDRQEDIAIDRNNTLCTESRQIIRTLEQKKPALVFSTGDARSRTIQSLLFMLSRLAKKEKLFSNERMKIKFWSIQLLLSDRKKDGWIPYIFLDGGGGSCLGKDGGAGNSIYGFCIQARKREY